MINKCLAIHMIHLVGSSELFTLYIRIVNPSNLRMAWLEPSIHSRILPYDTHCFKFLNFSFNKNKSHLNVLIFVLFFVSFVLVLLWLSRNVLIFKTIYNSETSLDPTTSVTTFFFFLANKNVKSFWKIKNDQFLLQQTLWSTKILRQSLNVSSV